MSRNTCIFVLILFGITFFNFHLATVTNDITNGAGSVYGRIITFMDETRSLCSHIDQITLPTANNFKHLIRNAHISCPNYTKMEPMLSHMGKMSSEHYSFIEEQVKDCRKLSNMLTNGDSIIRYLQEEKYSLVTSIIGKWHESFTKFSANFHLTDTSVQIMLDNSKVFYYDGLILTLEWFLIKSMVLVFLTTIVTLIFTWVSSVSGAALILYRFIKSFNENQPSASDYSPSREILHDYPVHPNVTHRRATKRTFECDNVCRSNSFENVASTSIMEHRTIIPVTFYAIIGVLIWIFVFCLLIATALLRNSATFSYYKPIRYNWYPHATSTLEIMKNDMDSLNFKFTRQIDSIEELLFRASAYQDKAVETVVDELVHTLVDVFRQVNEEMYNVHSLSKRMSSGFRRTYKHIEEKAKKARRLNETYGLLVEVNRIAESLEAFQSNLAVVVSDQRKIVSSLIEQTEFMRVLVQENRLIELGHVIRRYQNALMDIDGNTSKVEMAVNQVIELVDSRQLCEFKSIVASLTETSVYDQVKAIVVGATESATGTIVGVFTIRTGYTMAIIIPSMVRGPVIAVASGLGMIALGAYRGVSHFDNYIEASRFKSILAMLEIESANVEITMKQLKKVIGDQQKASTSSQSSLSTLAKYCGLSS